MRTPNGPAAAWPVIALFAERQHGAVARRQLLAAGLSAGVIGRLVRGSALHPVHRGVYAAGHPALMREGRWLAAVLACGEGAALSHRAAAALHGLQPAWSSFLEVSAPRSVRRVPAVIVHRPRSVEATEVDAIPVTTVSRTLLDVADVVGPLALRKVLEQAEVLRLDATPVPIPGRRGHAGSSPRSPISAASRSRARSSKTASSSSAGWRTCLLPPSTSSSRGWRSTSAGESTG